MEYIETFFLILSQKILLKVILNKTGCPVRRIASCSSLSFHCWVCWNWEDRSLENA